MLRNHCRHGKQHHDTFDHEHQARREQDDARCCRTEKAHGQGCRRWQDDPRDREVRLAPQVAPRDDRRRRPTGFPLLRFPEQNHFIQFNH
jgi:hypothetical protein